MASPNRENGKRDPEQLVHGLVDEIEQISAHLRQEELIRPMVGQIMDQCRALVWQELEKRTRRQVMDLMKNESQKRLESAFGKFSLVEQDIKTTIFERVQERISELIRQEVRKVVDDLLSNTDELLGEIKGGGSTEAGGLAADDLASSIDLLLGKTGGEQAPKADQRAFSSPPCRGAAVNTQAPMGPPSRPVSVASKPLPARANPAEPDRHAAAALETPRADPQTAPPSTNEMCQGTVQLQVSAEGSIDRTCNLINRLRQMPNVRLLEIVGSRLHGTSVQLYLQEPLPLRFILLETGEVAEVEPPVRSTKDADLTLFNLKLKETQVVS